METQMEMERKMETTVMAYRDYYSQPEERKEVSSAGTAIATHRAGFTVIVVAQSYYYMPRVCYHCFLNQCENMEA